MRVDAVTIQNVGPFDDVRIDLGPRRSNDLADLHVFLGPNGSGKSTLLYALAAALPHSDESGAAYGLLARGRSEFRVTMSAEGRAQVVEDARPRATYGGPTVVRGNLRFSAVPENSGGWRRNSPLWFAAFAYSGSRMVAPYSLSGISEPSGGPFEEALALGTLQSSGRLLSWLSSTLAKKAIAAEQGDDAQVGRFARAIAFIERAIEACIGDPVTLRARLDPLDVELQWRGRRVGLGTLPDGIKSILSWVADLVMRLDRIPWQGDLPFGERAFALLLDEIDVHLHPKWQRKILPMVQKLFPRAQVFVTTHSPFVVGSVGDAWIYPLDVDEEGRASVKPRIEAKLGASYEEILSHVFGVEERFDVETEKDLAAFYDERDAVLATRDPLRLAALTVHANKLGGRSVEVRDIVMAELAQARQRLARA